MNSDIMVGDLVAVVAIPNNPASYTMTRAACRGLTRTMNEDEFMPQTQAIRIINNVLINRDDRKAAFNLLDIPA